MLIPRYRLRDTPHRLEWVYLTWYTALRVSVLIVLFVAAIYSGQPLGPLGWFVLSFSLATALFEERWHWSKPAASLDHVWGLRPFLQRETYKLNTDAELRLEKIGRKSVLRLLAGSRDVVVDRALSHSGTKQLRELGESTARLLGLSFVVKEAGH